VILLEAAEKTVRNAVKIQKIIRWELLYCNLLSSKSGDGKSTSADTTQKVKSCLYSLKVDSGNLHVSKVVESKIVKEKTLVCLFCGVYENYFP